MKRILALLLAMLLLVPACAFAAGSVDITSVDDEGECAVTVHFDNPLGGKTTLLAIHAETSTTGSSSVIGQAERYESSYTFYDLAPGEMYLIYAMNDTDYLTAGSEIHLVKSASPYGSTNIRILDVNLCYFRPDSVQGDYGYNYANELSASKIESMLDEQNFLLKVDFRHSVFGNDSEKRALAVVTSPSGHISTNATTVTIHRNSEGFWQTMMYLNNAFIEMIEQNGSIPTGKYQVDIYLDGKLLGTDSFQILSH